MAFITGRSPALQRFIAALGLADACILGLSIDVPVDGIVSVTVKRACTEAEAEALATLAADPDVTLPVHDDPVPDLWVTP